MVELPGVIADLADRAAAACLLPLTLWIIVSGLDDLFILAVYVYARSHGKLPSAPPLGDTGPERRIAIFVPLWHEEAVIRGMLDHNLAAIRYGSYDFFVGAYPNDPGTVKAIRSVGARSERVHLALCPHDGPTSKADCMNWIYQRMLMHERDCGVSFDTVVIHDAEDLIHPDELRVVNHYSTEFDMIQVPVLPLPTPLDQWTHGLYCDDFAEFHTKDLPARWLLGGFIPSSGVGTAFSRRAIEALAACSSNQVFQSACLTEDYETGYRLSRLDFRQLFLPIHRSPDGQPVATREFFPKTFRSARKQRTRWVTGIALQGWARNGWGSTAAEAYWFWRDRKGLIGNPGSLLANLVFLYGLGTWSTSWLGPCEWGLGQHLSPHVTPALAWLATAVGLAQCGARTACAAAVYGWAFAIWSPARSVLGNLINSLASVSALHRFARSVWLGEPLSWIKTEHAYPSIAALDSYKQPVESILVASGVIAAEIVEEARKTAGIKSLAEHLLANNLISEEELLTAQMMRHHLPGGIITSNGVSASVLRLLPSELTTDANVVPVSIRGGVVKLACTDLPAELAMERLHSYTRLAFEFHLVTRRNFAELCEKLKA